MLRESASYANPPNRLSPPLPKFNKQIFPAFSTRLSGSYSCQTSRPRFLRSFKWQMFHDKEQKDCSCVSVFIASSQYALRFQSMLDRFLKRNLVGNFSCSSLLCNGRPQSRPASWVPLLFAPGFPPRHTASDNEVRQWASRWSERLGFKRTQVHISVYMHSAKRIIFGVTDISLARGRLGWVWNTTQLPAPFISSAPAAGDCLGPGW